MCMLVLLFFPQKTGYFPDLYRTFKCGDIKGIAHKNR